MNDSINAFAAFLSLAIAVAFSNRAQVLKESIYWTPASGTFLDEQGPVGVEAANAGNLAEVMAGAYAGDLDRALHPVCTACKGTGVIEWMGMQGVYPCTMACSCEAAKENS